MCIVHRKRTKSIPDTNQQRNASLAQSVSNITVFRSVGSDYMDVDPKEGDTVLLTRTGETFRVTGQALLRDEFKTIVPVAGPL